MQSDHIALATCILVGIIAGFGLAPRRSPDEDDPTLISVQNDNVEYWERERKRRYDRVVISQGRDTDIWGNYR